MKHQVHARYQIFDMVCVMSEQGYGHHPDVYPVKTSGLANLASLEEVLNAAPQLYN